jgi:hypothetical protein
VQAETWPDDNRNPPALSPRTGLTESLLQSCQCQCPRAVGCSSHRLLPPRDAPLQTDSPWSSNPVGSARPGGSVHRHALRRVRGHRNLAERGCVRASDGRWRALIGVDVADAPGSRSITVSARLSDETTISTTYTFSVEPKVFRTRRIRVDRVRDTGVRSRVSSETGSWCLFREASPRAFLDADPVRPIAGVAVSGFGVQYLNGQAGRTTD